MNKQQNIDIMKAREAVTELDLIQAKMLFMAEASEAVIKRMHHDDAIVSDHQVLGLSLINMDLKKELEMTFAALNEIVYPKG